MPPRPREQSDAGSIWRKNIVMGDFKHFCIFEKSLGPMAGNDEDVAEWLFGVARDTFLRDGYHGSLAFLFKRQRLAGIFGMSTESPSEKRLAQQNLAKQVTAIGADAVISISEAWIAMTTNFTGKESTSRMPNRIEALILMLASQECEPLMLTAPIHRDDSGLSLGDTIRQPLGAPIMFAAVYEAWGLKVPDQWSRDVKHVDGAIAVHVEGGIKPN